MTVIEEQRPASSELGPRAAAAGGLLAGVLAGFVASACCLLPLAVISVGIGGSLLSPLDALAPYQSYLFGGSGLSLVYGFWRSYREDKACAAGTLCATPQSRRRTRVLLSIGVVVFVAAVIIQAYGPQITALLI